MTAKKKTANSKEFGKSVLAAIINKKKRNEMAKWLKSAKMDKNGILYEIKRKGKKGEKPDSGTTVNAHYTGWLTDGKKFDSSHDRGQTLDFPVGIGQVIQGWDKSLLDMKKGEIRKVLIPSDLAYGERGAGADIPPNAPLIFEIELVDFK